MGMYDDCTCDGCRERYPWIFRAMAERRKARKKAKKARRQKKTTS